MATGCPKVLVKNVKNYVPGMLALASQVPKMLHVYKTLKARAEADAPRYYVEDHESWDYGAWKRFLSQEKNMWVDKDLDQHLSQQDIAQYHQFRQDMYRVFHGNVLPLTAVGGWSLLLAPFFMANDSWMPSTFSRTPEEKAQWREAQDLYRYKHTPSMLTDFRWWLDFHLGVPQESLERPWEEINEKNDVRRDPTLCSRVTELFAKIQPFHCPRRKQVRYMARAMNIPTWPFFGKACAHTRIRDYYEIMWNEDYMVIKGQLHKTMTEEQLFDYAWRRFMAPADKKLSQKEILQRVEDYHAFLGQKFVETGKAPSVWVVAGYLHGYYHEPGYLELDIAELDKDDFTSVAQLGKDAFLRRLEFENGYLRDQVEAHSQKVLADREAALKSVTA